MFLRLWYLFFFLFDDAVFFFACCSQTGLGGLHRTTTESMITLLGDIWRLMVELVHLQDKDTQETFQIWWKYLELSNSFLPLYNHTLLFVDLSHKIYSFISCEHFQFSNFCMAHTFLTKKERWICFICKNISASSHSPSPLYSHTSKPSVQKTALCFHSNPLNCEHAKS